MSAIPVANSNIRRFMESDFGYPSLLPLPLPKLGFELAGSISKTVRLQNRGGSWALHKNHDDRLSLLAPIKAVDDKGITCADDEEGKTREFRRSSNGKRFMFFGRASAFGIVNICSQLNVDLGVAHILHFISLFEQILLLAFSSAKIVDNVGNSTNIVWHECPVDKLARQQLLQQKGCVIWITGLSGSGKSTLACALSCGLHSRGKLTYILDGDNVRHGLNSDLSFTAKDREENIRRIGEVAKLCADAGIICIACLISPYRKDRAVCRALLPKGRFIEVFMDVPLQICEARDPKGLYKQARAGKIKGFTGIDDPYEPPLDCEVVLQQKGLDCNSPHELAEKVILYLEDRGYLEA